MAFGNRVPMIDDAMPLSDVELQAVTERFVAAAERVAAIMQTLPPAPTAGRCVLPLIELNDPRRLEVIEAVAQASVQLARYRMLADRIALRDAHAVSRLGIEARARHEDCGARSRSFSPTTV